VSVCAAPTSPLHIVCQWLWSEASSTLHIHLAEQRKCCLCRDGEISLHPFPQTFIKLNSHWNDLSNSHCQTRGSIQSVSLKFNVTAYMSAQSEITFAFLSHNL
jgi:hypothetical protein